MSGFNNLDYEEHDFTNNAKKVNVVSGTITASSQITVTPQQAWPDPKSFIGLVTIAGGTVGNTGNVTLNPSPNFIGIVTVANPGSSVLSGNVTLDPGSKTGIVGNVTISDSKGYIGLVTATLGNGNPSVQSFGQFYPSPQSIASGGLGPLLLDQFGRTQVVSVGNVTLDPGSKTGIVGNVTLSDSKGYIGLTTGTLGAGTAQVGSVTISHPLSIAGNLTLSDPKGFIGLVTIVGSLSPAAGNVTLDPGSKTGIVGNVTLSDSKTYVGLVTATIGNVPNVSVIGNVTLSGSPSVQSFGQFFPVLQSIASGGLGPIALDNFGRVQAKLTGDPNTYIGLATVDIGASNGVAVKGNVTLSDSKGFIGLVTAVGSFAANIANVTLNPGPNKIGIVTVGHPITINDSNGIEMQIRAGGQVGVQLTDGTNDVRLGIVDGGAIGDTTYALDVNSKNLVLDVANDNFYAVRDANNANATTGRGVPASGSMGFDGTNYYRIFASSDGIQKSLVTVSNTLTVNAHGITGNVTLSDSKGFIGLVTLGGGTAWTDPKTYIGLVTATMAGSVNTGMTTIFPGPNYIGLVTVDIGSQNSVAIKGNITLSDPKGFIGLVTIVGSLSPAAGNVTLDPGSKTGIVGNVTISDSKGYIGLVTATIGSSPSVQAFGQFFPVIQSIASGGLGPIAVDNFGEVLLGNSKGYVGLVTVDIGSQNSIAVKGNVTLSDSKAFIGLVTLGGGTAWTDPKTFIGLVTVGNTVATTWAGNVTLSDAKTYIGLTTTTLGVGTTFVGLVTAVTRNAGTLKTLVSLPVGLGNNSLATVAVPTNANKINTTQLVLNSNITTEIAIKSGVTYLTGNASLGITIFPGGGFVMSGAPDSPAWIGLPSGAMVVEKRDPGGTVSKIGGGVIYFDE